MFPVFLALGSNIGDKWGFLKAALSAINELPGTRIDAISPVYETLPYGVEDQGDFLNLVIRIETDFAPEVLLDELKTIERATGRVERKRWYEREIDIDILLYGDTILRSENLNIPHLELEKRDFFLLPLLDLDPAIRLPGSGIFPRDLKITLEKPYIKGLSRIFFELRNGFVCLNEPRDQLHSS